MEKNHFDYNEYERWMAQAKNTLKGAELDLNTKQYNWSCFKSHQSVEFALKAVLYGLGNTPFGHSLVNLVKKVESLKDVDMKAYYKCIKLLERHYIPSRYADSFASGAPFEYYDEPTAKEAINCAREIITYLESLKP